MLPPYKFFITDGIAVYIGRDVQTKLHVHHALEIVMAIETPFLTSLDGINFEESHCSIVSADVPHQFIGQNGYYIFLYFDAELDYTTFLEETLPIAKQGILHYQDSQIPMIRNLFFDWLCNDTADTDAPIHIVQLLLKKGTAQTDLTGSLDERVMSAIKIVHSSIHKEISLENIAAAVYLSESRFAHLFKEETGIPFRRYVLWCRLQASLKAVVCGESFTAAAYEGGFSDVAHLSRTFSEMFGVSPSEVLKK